MQIAVLDSSVVVSGVGWHSGPARQVLCRLALRHFQSAHTSALAAEWDATLSRVADAERSWANRNWSSWLDWLRRVSRPVLPVPLRRTVKRDPSDDVVLEAALASRARWLVSFDHDLLALGKPWGIEVVTPARFLEALAES